MHDVLVWKFICLCMEILKGHAKLLFTGWNVDKQACSPPSGYFPPLPGKWVLVMILW